MTDTMLDQLRRIAGAEVVRREPGGSVRVAPPSTAAVAGVMGMAHDTGWRVTVEGAATWRAEAAPADLILSTRALDDVDATPVEPGVIRVGAGAPLERVRRHTLDLGGWIPLDPPGRPDRTVGAVLSTGTDGPLRLGVGGLADQVHRLTVVTGEGRVLLSDEPAHADLVRLQLGTFGGLGVICEAALRLHELPRTDTTWARGGSRDRLTAAAREIAERHLPVMAVELFSPALALEGEWLLAVRVLGPRDAAAIVADRLAAIGGGGWFELPPERRILLWNGAARGVTSVPVTLRLGVLAESLDETIDTVLARLGEGMLSASPASGRLRWSGVADATALRELRGELAPREIPLTLERAPWRVLRAVGHFGAYREGAGPPLEGLRERFDPRGVLVAALEGGMEP
ncbi:MAG: FAD-binding oxidoreductase [Gemmatimonadetes bacterium]|nr:FAD-binding oxidoreductase [Gemmatimonadota bacterium]